MKAQHRYDYWLKEETDIKDHLPRLFEAASGNVLELGVRSGVSTAALLAGIEARGGHLWSVDRDGGCEAAFNGHPNWTFIQADSLDSARIKAAGVKEPLDVLFIDTNHELHHTLLELNTWGPLVKVGGQILLHDAITFPGVREAMEIFCGEFGLPFEVIPGSNGLGIITMKKEIRHE